MANEIAVVSKKALALRAANANFLKAINDSAKEGVFVSFPTITLKATRFAVNENGVQNVLDATKIGVIVLNAKGPYNKAFYLTKFNPEEEGKQPDCFSTDGTKPDPQSAMIQHTICASCPRNQFGTGKDQNGNPTKGKACTDSKVLAVTPGDRDINGDLKIYQFKVPPASLQNWNKYVQELDKHGVYLPEVVTVIGFDPTATFAKLVFNHGPSVGDEIIDEVYAAINGDITLQIINASPKEKKDIDNTPTPTPKEEAKPEPEPTPEPAKEEVVGFGNVTLTSAPESEKKPAKEKKAKVTSIGAGLVSTSESSSLGIATSSATPAASGQPSDDELRAKLGL